MHCVKIYDRSHWLFILRLWKEKSFQLIAEHLSSVFCRIVCELEYLLRKSRNLFFSSWKILRCRREMGEERKVLIDREPEKNEEISVQTSKTNSSCFREAADQWPDGLTIGELTNSINKEKNPQKIIQWATTSCIRQNISFHQPFDAEEWFLMRLQ